ncbi:hypothetical protein [Thalassobacillus hwangdonensis]|uniref:SnoaL-like domain-containing protein n=1 Tax=Thalassobacillus hwangdonensis TaxID=546108 RepID=A0ABW3L2J4_9BACI
MTAMFLLTGGCAENSNEESVSEQNIRTFLQSMLNGPDEEFIEAMNFQDKDFEMAAKRYAEYKIEHFKPYLSDRFFENFVGKSLMATEFLRMAHPEYKLEVEEIELEVRDEEKNSYNFTVKVTYTNIESNESDTVDFRGIADANDEGKITGVHYYNSEELYEALNYGI